jgi:HEAT repeats
MGDRSGRDLFHDLLTGKRKTKPGLVQRHIDQVKKDVHDPQARALIGINEASRAFLGPFSMGVSVVEEYAKNTSAPAEGLCAGLLSVNNTPDTVEQLALALAGRNWAVRAAAAKALARMNRVEMIPQLTEMMNADKDEPARLVAAAAIIRLKDHRRTAAPLPTPSVAPTEQGRKP